MHHHFSFSFPVYFYFGVGGGVGDSLASAVGGIGNNFICKGKTAFDYFYHFCLFPLLLYNTGFRHYCAFSIIFFLFFYFAFAFLFLFISRLYWRIDRFFLPSFFYCFFYFCHRPFIKVRSLSIYLYIYLCSPNSQI